MSTSVDLPTQVSSLPMDELKLHDLVKPEMAATKQTAHEKSSQVHPLHQYDVTIMKKLYDACVGKFKEHTPSWKPSEWARPSPDRHTELKSALDLAANPHVHSQKQRVYETFAKLAKESGEPMVLLPSFDYGDIANFERFLQAIKMDGVNAIGKYKQYLNNKDTRKYEVDLVIVHPRYGVLLVDVKECDHLDNRRRSRARAHLRAAKECFDSMGRLIAEAHGWTHAEASLKFTEILALPHIQERPVNTYHQRMSGSNTLNTSLNQTGSSTASANGNTSKSTAPHRQLLYLIKSDLSSADDFAKWWTQYVVEPKQEHMKTLEAENKVNKFDLDATNALLGLIHCIRSNAIMPVVYPEGGRSDEEPLSSVDKEKEKEKENSSGDDKEKEKDRDVVEKDKESTDAKDAHLHQPALNVYAEMFEAEHEAVRALSKVVVVCKDAEKLRKIVCMQTMWLMLNDAQKKISVVCTEMNKAYYESYFARQRKLYNSLNNVRFYADVHSCPAETQHTIKKDGEIWFFDNGIKTDMSAIVERVKELAAFWVFTTQDDDHVYTHKSTLDTLGARIAKLETHTADKEKSMYLENERDAHERNPTTDKPLAITTPWLSGEMLKLPLRLHCDLLVIGDLVNPIQMKVVYRYLKDNQVPSQAYQYSKNYDTQHHYNQHPQQQQIVQLSFNPVRKFRSVKFIRGGSAENLRTALKMHDSIHAPVVLVHAGDEDLFKTRSASVTAERVKELATLVKEFCPKSFVILSTLMRRVSRSDNTNTHDVNKDIVAFCKKTKETLNCHYMLNNQLEPDYHTQEGRALTGKGLRSYVHNLLFTVDAFLIRNQKQ